MQEGYSFMRYLLSSFMSTEATAFGFEGSDSTAAVRRSPQVQGSERSAALSRTSLLEHSKTLDSGKTS